MGEVVSPVLKEGNSRMIAIIFLFLTIGILIYLFFTVMLSCMAVKTTGQCFKQYWLVYLFVVVFCAFAYVPLMQLIHQIMRNFEVKDDYLLQLRRKAELDNIKTLKEMGYKKLQESEYSDGVKKLIGIYKLPKKTKFKWKFWKK